MGISSPLTGLMPLTPPRQTPVLSLFSSVRSRSDLESSSYYKQLQAESFIIIYPNR